MDSPQHHTSRLRDEPYLSYDLSHAVYGALPPCAPDTSPRRSCASSPCRKKIIKRPRSVSNMSQHIMSSTAHTTAASWLSRPAKRIFVQHDQRMDLHQSTCLNLNTASQDSAQADLWILPDFDEWALETENAPRQAGLRQCETTEWAPLLHRAAKSNLERLRARLEGDGWAFVGGRYEDEKKDIQQEATLGDERVDDEFDLVVLPLVHVSC